MSSHPPKPRLALALGVVGHRPNRLPVEALAQVTADIDAVLKGFLAAAGAARDRYQDFVAIDPPLLSLVSAIAEGADRMAADAALARGFTLAVPLPFPIEVYEKDFATEASRAHYRNLLSRAATVLELPGTEASRDEGYERVGVTILGQCDMVLAVWDGGPPAGRGGTTAMIMAAARAALPIICIDATGQRRPRILWSGFAKLPGPVETLDELPSHGLDEGMPLLIDELTRPPSESAERKHLAAYLGERAHGRNWRLEFPLLMALAGVRRLRRSDLDPQDPEVNAQEHAAPAAGLLASLAVRSPPEISRAYGWASAVGSRFGQFFRSAYVANFVLAAIAVAAAAASLLAPEELVFALIETLLIGGVILNTVVGQRSAWHRRWIEAREIAERLRAALCLWALAARPPAFHGEEPTWTGWYSRAFTRAQGMRGGALDRAGLAEARRLLLALIVDQRAYHSTTCLRMSRLEHRLERLGLALFILTALFAIDHLTGGHAMHAVLPGSLDAGLVATALGAGLPALATATYGIRVIGDIEGVAHRSERAHMALRTLQLAVEADPFEIGLLRARARATVDAMLGDVSSWRIAAESRGLDLPG